MTFEQPSTTLLSSSSAVVVALCAAGPLTNGRQRELGAAPRHGGGDPLAAQQARVLEQRQIAMERHRQNLAEKVKKWRKPGLADTLVQIGVPLALSSLAIYVANNVPPSEFPLSVFRWPLLLGSGLMLAQLPLTIAAFPLKRRLYRAFTEAAAAQNFEEFVREDRIVAIKADLRRLCRLEQTRLGICWFTAGVFLGTALSSIVLLAGKVRLLSD